MTLTLLSLAAGKQSVGVSSVLNAALTPAGRVWSSSPGPSAFLSPVLGRAQPVPPLPSQALEAYAGGNTAPPHHPSLDTPVTHWDLLVSGLRPASPA